MWRKFLGKFLKTTTTQLAFSAITVRKDKKNLEKSIIETNARLKNYCLQKGLGYIENNGMKHCQFLILTKILKLIYEHLNHFKNNGTIRAPYSQNEQNTS